MRLALTALIAIFLGLPVNVAGQQHMEEAQPRSVPGEEQRLEPGEEPEISQRRYRGVDVGSMVIFPTMVFSSYYDDNIFVTDDDATDDVVYLFSPSVLVDSNWERHHVRVEGGADVARYDDNSRENHEHYRALVEGRYDIDNRTNVFAGLRYNFDTEDRESPDDVFGREPTTFEDYGAYAGGFKQIGRFWLRAGGTYQHLNFNDVPSALGIINNDDRDRDIFTGGTNFGYLITPNFSGVIQGSVDVREYPNGLDDFGFDRDSQGYRLLFGGTYARANVIEGEFYIGYMRQDYDDPSFKDVTDVVVSGSVDLFLGPNTTLSAYVDRILSETTAFGSSSYINSYAGMTLTHTFTDRLSVNVRSSVSRIEFNDIDREEDYLSVGASVRYLVGRYVYLQADYAHRLLDSPIPDEDFKRNQYFLRLGVYL